MGRDIYDIETTVDDERQANGDDQEAYAAVLEATIFYSTGGSEMGAIRLRHLA